MHLSFTVVCCELTAQPVILGLNQTPLFWRTFSECIINGTELWFAALISFCQVLETPVMTHAAAALSAF